MGSIFVTTIVTVVLLAIFNDDQNDEVCQKMQRYHVKTETDVPTGLAAGQQEDGEEDASVGLETVLLDGAPRLISTGEIEEEILRESGGRSRRENDRNSRGSMRPESLQSGATVRRDRDT